ncbi:MAG: type IV pilus biogenesis/stability protein PilW [Gammaproteobacteria bacterium]
MKVVCVSHLAKRLAILGVFISLLTACFTNKAVVNEENERVIKVAKINVQLGMAYLENNNIQRAKQKLLLALRQGPTLPETWFTMAYFLEATGDKEQAGVYYLKAISVAPQRGDAQNNYGTFLCRSGEYKASVHHFMLAVKDPDYLDVAGAYENAGLCALKIPNKQLAKQYFQMAVRQDPKRSAQLMRLANQSEEKPVIPHQPVGIVQGERHGVVRAAHT